MPPGLAGPGLVTGRVNVLFEDAGMAGICGGEVGSEIGKRDCCIRVRGLLVGVVVWILRGAIRMPAGRVETGRRSFWLGTEPEVCGRLPTFSDGLGPSLTFGGMEKMDPL